MNPLREAYDYMDRYGWIQRRDQDLTTGAVCLSGALWRTTSNIARSREILREVCEEQYGKGIFYTNDLLLNFKEEALALLDKAAVLWEERNS